MPTPTMDTRDTMDTMDTLDTLATWHMLKDRCHDLNDLILSQHRLEDQRDRLRAELAEAQRPRPIRSRSVQTSPRGTSTWVQTDPPVEPASSRRPTQGAGIPNEGRDRPFISFLDSDWVGAAGSAPPKPSASIDFFGSLEGFEPEKRGVPFVRQASLVREPIRPSTPGLTGGHFLPPTLIQVGVWLRPVLRLAPQPCASQGGTVRERTTAPTAMSAPASRSRIPTPSRRLRPAQPAVKRRPSSEARPQAKKLKLLADRESSSSGTESPARASADLFSASPPIEGWITEPPSKRVSSTQALIFSSSSSESEPEEIAVKKESQKSSRPTPERRHGLDSSDLIPLGANPARKPVAKKVLNISAIKKELEAKPAAAKKPLAPLEPKTGRPFSRLPSGLLPAESTGNNGPPSDKMQKISRRAEKSDLEASAKYEAPIPRRRISLMHPKRDSSDGRTRLSIDQRRSSSDSSDSKTVTPAPPAISGLGPKPSPNPNQAPTSQPALTCGGSKKNPSIRAAKMLEPVMDETPGSSDIDGGNITDPLALERGKIFKGKATKPIKLGDLFDFGPRSQCPPPTSPDYFPNSHTCTEFRPKSPDFLDTRPQIPENSRSSQGAEAPMEVMVALDSPGSLEIDDMDHETSSEVLGKKYSSVPPPTLLSPEPLPNLDAPQSQNPSPPVPPSSSSPQSGPPSPSHLMSSPLSQSGSVLDSSEPLSDRPTTRDPSGPSYEPANLSGPSSSDQSAAHTPDLTSSEPPSTPSTSKSSVNTFVPEFSLPPPKMTMSMILRGKSYLEHSFELFKMSHKMKEDVLSKREQLYMADEYQREIFTNLVRSQLGRLWKVNDQETFENIVKQLSKPEFAPGGKYTRSLFSTLTKELSGEKSIEGARMEMNDPAVPSLTGKQLKLASLWAALDSAQGMQGILEQYVDHLWFSIFGKNRLYVMSFVQARLLVTFYITLLRIKGMEDRCRLFLYDTIFFRSPRNHSFFLLIVEIWPEILTRTGNSMDEIIVDPILEAIIWMVYNTGDQGQGITMKIYDAQNALKDKCRFPNPKCNAAEICKKFLRIGLSAGSNEQLLDSLNRALLLVSRCQEYQWTHNNLIRPLLEILGKYCQDSKEESQKVLRWVIEAIGLMSRCYPVDARKHLEQLFEPLVKLLESQKLLGKTEITCLIALLRVGHHLQLQVSKFLQKWTPRHLIPPNVAEIVANFVGTRGRKFTETTINIHSVKNKRKTRSKAKNKRQLKTEVK